MQTIYKYGNKAVVTIKNPALKHEALIRSKCTNVASKKIDSWRRGGGGIAASVNGKKI